MSETLHTSPEVTLDPKLKDTAQALLRKVREAKAAENDGLYPPRHELVSTGRLVIEGMSGQYELREAWQPSDDPQSPRHDKAIDLISYDAAFNPETRDIEQVTTPIVSFHRLTINEVDGARTYNPVELASKVQPDYVQRIMAGVEIAMTPPQEPQVRPMGAQALQNL